MIEKIKKAFPYLFKNGEVKVVSQLGKGGFGTAYQIAAGPNSEHFVLKETNSCKDAQGEFVYLARLGNSTAPGSGGLVKYYDASSLEIKPVILMEYCNFKDMNVFRLDCVKNGEFNALMTTLESNFSNLLRALNLIHSSGLVHRDIKLNNIFLTRRTRGTAGKDEKVEEMIVMKFGDFGIMESNMLSIQDYSTSEALPEIVRDDLCDFFKMFTNALYWDNPLLNVQDELEAFNPLLAKILRAVWAAGKNLNPQLSAAGALKLLEDESKGEGMGTYYERLTLVERELEAERQKEIKKQEDLRISREKRIIDLLLKNKNSMELLSGGKDSPAAAASLVCSYGGTSVYSVEANGKKFIVEETARPCTRGSSNSTGGCDILLSPLLVLESKDNSNSSITILDGSSGLRKLYGEPNAIAESVNILLDNSNFVRVLKSLKSSALDGKIDLDNFFVDGSNSLVILDRRFKDYNRSKSDREVLEYGPEKDSKEISYAAADIRALGIAVAKLLSCCGAYGFVLDYRGEINLAPLENMGPGEEIFVKKILKQHMVAKNPSLMLTIDGLVDAIDSELDSTALELEVLDEEIGKCDAEIARLEKEGTELPPEKMRSDLNSSLECERKFINGMNRVLSNYRSKNRVGIHNSTCNDGRLQRIEHYEKFTEKYGLEDKYNLKQYGSGETCESSEERSKILRTKAAELDKKLATESKYELCPYYSSIIDDIADQLGAASKEEMDRSSRENDLRDILKEKKEEVEKKRAQRETLVARIKFFVKLRSERFPGNTVAKNGNIGSLGYGKRVKLVINNFISLLEFSRSPDPDPKNLRLLDDTGATASYQPDQWLGVGNDYRAPELLDCSDSAGSSRTADIYSAGIIMAELLCARKLEPTFYGDESRLASLLLGSFSDRSKDHLCRGSSYEVFVKDILVPLSTKGSGGVTEVYQAIDEKIQALKSSEINKLKNLLAEAGAEIDKLNGEIETLSGEGRESWERIRLIVEDIRNEYGVKNSQGDSEKLPYTEECGVPKEFKISEELDAILDLLAASYGQIDEASKKKVKDLFNGEVLRIEAYRDIIRNLNSNRNELSTKRTRVSDLKRKIWGYKGALDLAQEIWKYKGEVEYLNCKTFDLYSDLREKFKVQEEREKKKEEEERRRKEEEEVKRIEEEKRREEEEKRREEEEKRKRKEEEERRKKEEEKRREEEERKRIEEEKRRIEEEKRREEEEEVKRIEEEKRREEEEKRKRKEEEEVKRIEEEKRRKEEERRKKEEEKRREEEEERRRKEEEEVKRIEEEKRKRKEEEERRKKEEEEVKRIEEEKRKRKEEEERRKKEEEERRKKEEEERRKKEEEEVKRIEEEKRRIEEKKRRIEEEKRRIEEEKRKRIEEEKRRKEEEKRKRKEKEEVKKLEEEVKKLEEEVKKLEEEAEKLEKNIESLEKRRKDYDEKTKRNKEETKKLIDKALKLKKTMEEDEEKRNKEREERKKKEKEIKRIEEEKRRKEEEERKRKEEEKRRTVEEARYAGPRGMVARVKHWALSLYRLTLRLFCLNCLSANGEVGRTLEPKEGREKKH
jgi:serine/threonine protein kinase